MQFAGLQKLTSFFLIFFLLFSFALRVPIIEYFSNIAFAGEEEYFELISFIVDEDTYDTHRSKIVQYSRDVQKYLENTRVVILPVPKGANVFDIASLNESLYFEGYTSLKDVDFTSRLVGTVLIGDIPVPVVFDNGDAAKTIIPYVDFEEKTYIYHHTEKKYQRSEQADSDIHPEIWHGVIAPNTGSSDGDNQAFEAFFAKNHDFYTGKGVFQHDVIDGTSQALNEDYEPYVFYYDQFRENTALQYQKYVGYDFYQKHVEDITYNRYSKELAKQVSDEILGIQNYELKDLIGNVAPDLIPFLDDSGMDVEHVTDIATKYITDNGVRKFLDVFNASTLGELRTNVYNAGRYNQGGSKVNVDMPPFLVSLLDEVSASVIQNVNSSLETYITDIVANGLSRKIAIPTNKTYVVDSTTYVVNTGTDQYGRDTTEEKTITCTGIDTNFYFGMPAQDISTASQCSIYRGGGGGGTLVESNRGYNIQLAEDDAQLCGQGMRYDEATGRITKGLTGFWGGNTPVNFVSLQDNSATLQLGDHSVYTSVRPVFDILGSKKITDTTHIPSPLDCFNEGRFIKTHDEYLYTEQTRNGNDIPKCYTKLSVPLSGNSIQYYTEFLRGKGRENRPRGTTSVSRFCGKTNTGTPIITSLDYIQQYLLNNANQNSNQDLSIGTTGTIITSGTQNVNTYVPTYGYKTIPSYILHTSPTPEEFGTQVESMFTPNLPIDKDRYIDFIGATGGPAPEYGYQRIDFPQLFRLDIGDQDVNFTTISEATKKQLDTVSSHINTIIRQTNPQNLTGQEKDIYELLKTGDFPEDTIDLYSFLENKLSQTVNFNGAQHDVEYLDTLLFAIYWNNLKTPSAKYKFIFENYLSSNGFGDTGDFILPRAKPSYEISYLAAPGDTQNMYVKLDPEKKLDHPYSSILAQNIALQTTLTATNIAPQETDEQGVFECAPPDGVPLWEWIPAVICWMQDMLPPTISISQGGCGDETLFLDEDERDAYEACDGDINKNGVNDCIENTLDGGSIELVSDAGRYYYNTSGILELNIFDKNGDIAKFDNQSMVDSYITRVEIPADPTQPFSSANTKLIYSRGDSTLGTPEAREQVEKYISFRDLKYRVHRGTITSYFATKGYDANIYFESSLTLKDAKDTTLNSLTSNSEKIEIRGDRLFVQGYTIDEEGYRAGSNISASTGTNIFLLDGNTNGINDVTSQIEGSSSAKQKLAFFLHNYSPAGNVLSIEYPLHIELFAGKKSVFSQEGVSSQDIATPLPIFEARQSGIYTLHITDATGFKVRKTFHVFPEEATRISPEISTNIMQTGGNITTHFFTILDQYDNPATKNVYDVDISIDGGGIVFDQNGEKNISYTIIEGYKAFRLKSQETSSSNTLTFTLKDASGNVVDIQKKYIRTIDGITMELTQLDEAPKVGGKSYGYSAVFSDTDGNILSDLQSRVYLGIPKIYGVTDMPYTQIVDGKARVSFTTRNLASESVFLELQFEGGNTLYKAPIQILPDDPIKIDLSLSDSKIEANPDASALLEAILKDRYNNVVFNDNTTQLSLHFHDTPITILQSPTIQKTVSAGKTTFRIFGTQHPGTGYFKVSSTPDLANNSFDIVGQAPFLKQQLLIPTMKTADGELTETGKLFFKEFSQEKFISRFSTLGKLTHSEAYQQTPTPIQQQLVAFWEQTNHLTVHGIGENTGSIETFYFWGEDDIVDNSYNGIYSVLSGGPYGDITQEQYLAGGMLFDRNNQSLAVTTLLNTPYHFQDVFGLEENGHLQKIQNANISQDIQFFPDFDIYGRLQVDIYNAALDAYIGRVYYTLSKNSDIDLVANTDDGYTFEQVGDRVAIISPTGKKLFFVEQDGKFSRVAGSYVVFDDTYQGRGIRLNIFSGTTRIGTMTVAGDFTTNITRDTDILQQKLNTLDDSIIVYLRSQEYSSHELYIDGTSKVLNFYYQDPFADPYTMNDFHLHDTVGLESAQDESGIGWKESNTMMLNVAAGQSVGEATKYFQSFSMINLGDPVASLKHKDFYFKENTQKKSFDPTVGELLETQEDLIGYETFDYNNDEKIDIVTIQKDGYIKLFEKSLTTQKYINHRHLVFAADGGSRRLVKTGDFTGDGYGDIFFVTDTGQPALFNNHLKDFTRLDIASQLSLSGSIIQAETYDMDVDGKDDIITLDDAGEIHIFYGGGDAEQPQFSKKFIGDGYGIELSSTPTNNGGVIYFDGLPQPNTGEYEQMQQQVQEFLAAGEDSNPEFINAPLVNNLLYVPMPYNASVGSTAVSVSNSASYGTAELEEFAQNTNDYVYYNTNLNNRRNAQTFFLRSQYADTQGITVEKTFTDTTPPYLQTGDRVFFDISLQNTGTTPIENVVYADTLPEYFAFINDSFTVLTEDNREIDRQPGRGGYNIFIDNFRLDAGETVKIRFEIETLPLSYGHMQVGLYEQGEVGDDIYGDIVIKDDEKNCGEEADIFRSIGTRKYQEGKTQPVCDAADVDISEQFPELVDANTNGVPDYLEDILSSDPEEAVEVTKQYAETVREDFYQDSDGDLIPDTDDPMDYTNANDDFMAQIGKINEAIDEIADEMDAVIEGFGCGFGGGSCIATPLNWAPLAPGSDPTLYGKPIGDGLKIDEGLPIFSSLTGLQMTCGHSPCCIPSVWPVTPQTYIPGPKCGGPGAGGSLGANSPTNSVRIFATPTLTGGFGTAYCYGAPASVVGNANPPGVHPVVPGGNCVVVAMPLIGCEGGEGDPGVTGYPYTGDGFGVIHANCDGEGSLLYTPQTLDKNFTQEYISYQSSGDTSPGFFDRYKEALQTVGGGNPEMLTLPTQPLINIGSGDDGVMSTSVSIDTAELSGGNFSDIVQVENTRIGAFPSFVMDWAERQLDEITSKLTNLPKVYVILPDFGGILDGSWGDLEKNNSEIADTQSQQKVEDTSTKRQTLAQVQQQKSSLECAGKDAARCNILTQQILSLKQQIEGQAFGGEAFSGMQEVYEFIGNIPLIDLETETINISIPWIDQSELNRFQVDWEYALDQWSGELEEAKEAWSYGLACNEETPAKQARCEQENGIKQKAVLQAEGLISSLERNIEVLEEYGTYPDQIAELMNVKEEWLEQILCNIEAISSMTGEWIATNGERFKAWVELYVLIKASLKSWQAFIDIFNDYEEECHECKNERHDLQDFSFQLISSVIPSAPIIEFPKFPDIILDLHNIRIGMTVYMPDFQISPRPIVLPTLPELNLPDAPSADISLPPLPTLPTLEFPEMPELPSLPTVELPDLPPPPQIPELFGSVEGILDVMKLVTKAMCILKNSPFVPEWRAGDQIAFLTERNGYLPTDFIDIQMPQFSYSAISAIKVAAYVNLEFETEFLLEAVRSITAPLNSIGGNVVNMFETSISDINVDVNIPTQIDIDVESDGTIDTDISFESLETHPENIYSLAELFAGQFMRMISFMDERRGNLLTNKEYTAYVTQQLASENITRDTKTTQLQKIWEEVHQHTYSQQDQLIAQMQDYAQQKYDTLENIITTEIEETKKQKSIFHTLEAPSILKQISNQYDTRFESYAGLLAPHNARMIASSMAVINGEDALGDALETQLQTTKQQIQKQARKNFGRYDPQKQLAATPSSTPPSSETLTCQSNGAYSYTYEGMYVKEYGKNYRLFDYIEPLRGDEEPHIEDLDNDGDDDVLYMVEGRLYFKENRQNQPTTHPFSGPPLVVKATANTFVNGDVFYESVNYFRETEVSDRAINIQFAKPTLLGLNNFRMTYNTIVDRYMSLVPRREFTPQIVQQHIVDAIADTHILPDVSPDDTRYTLKKHLATLTYAPAIEDLSLTTQKFQDISDLLHENTLVTVTANNMLYTGKQNAKITYRLPNNDEEYSVKIPKHHSWSFPTGVEITKTSDSVYLDTGILQTLSGSDIIDHIGMPLLPETKIIYDGNSNTLDGNSHVDIEYYDDSILKIDIREVTSYTLYDLGNSTQSEYHIHLPLKNDFYYATIQAFGDDILSTSSRQILLAPQKYNDHIPPQIGFSQKIRIPVYQSQVEDISSYIYEDGGFSGISDVWVDFDLGVDSDGDGNSTNDRTSTGIVIDHTPSRIAITFGPYDTLFEKLIRIFLKDNNDNIGYKDIPFMVYSPQPSITDIDDATIIGKIDEKLLDEPLRLYRYRGGTVERLQNIDGNSVVDTDVEGNYNFVVPATSDGLVLTYSGSTIANIDEYTGYIDVLDPLLTQISVESSNDIKNTSVYPEIVIEYAGKPIFEQFLKIPPGEVFMSHDLSAGGQGIFVKLINQDTYNIFQMSRNISYNAGSIAIFEHDDTQNPVAVIFQDGRIDIDTSQYHLNYTRHDGYVMLELRDSIDNTIVAEILYRVEGNYILR